MRGRNSAAGRFCRPAEPEVPKPEPSALDPNGGDISQFKIDPVDQNIRRMLELVTSSVQPTTWDEVGGPGRSGRVCFENVRALVIAQTDDVHAEVAELLAALRSAKRDVTAGKAKLYLWPFE